MPELLPDGAAPPSGRARRRRGLLLGVTPGAALGWIVAAAVVVSMLGAVFVFLSDRDAFDSFWDALWWSVVTVGTVGYGDVVPTNGAGRAIGAVLILFTMALFPVLTGIVTAALIDQRRREASRDEQRRAEERHAAMLRALGSIDDRLSRLERDRR
jgi:voltage-gated potassium channel